MWLLLLSLAFAAPKPPTVSATEETQLTSREVVVRTHMDGDTQVVLAMMDVDATPEATFAAIMDLNARVDEVSSMESVEIYEDTPSKVGAKYVLKLPGFSATFHVIYKIDAAQHFAAYAGDPTKENDVNGGAGSYHVVPLEDGTSRVYYRVRVADDGPSWLKSALIQRNLPEQLEGIRARAEAS